MQNCAREPEVADLAACSTRWAPASKARAPRPSASRASTSCTARDHRIIPDRIEAGTFLIAGAHHRRRPATSPAAIPQHLDCAAAEAAGGRRQDRRRPADSVRVMRRLRPLKAVDMTTEEYPGFPTDLQAQYMALMTQAEGTRIVTENIFENRFMHAQELVRMGANIKIEGRRADRARASTPLSGAAVLASDLRASALAGAGRPGGRRRNHHRPRLPHRPRLREHRGEAARRRRPDPPHRRNASQARDCSRRPGLKNRQRRPFR